MNNPTVETDLVGEVIELHAAPSYKRGFERDSHLSARGRCRAVTCDSEGGLLLWLEKIDPCLDCLGWISKPDVRIGALGVYKISPRDPSYVIVLVRQ